MVGCPVRRTLRRRILDSSAYHPKPVELLEPFVGDAISVVSPCIRAGISAGAVPRALIAGRSALP